MRRERHDSLTAAIPKVAPYFAALDLIERDLKKLGLSFPAYMVNMAKLSLVEENVDRDMLVPAGDHADRVKALARSLVDLANSGSR